MNRVKIPLLFITVFSGYCKENRIACKYIWLYGYDLPVPIKHAAGRLTAPVNESMILSYSLWRAKRCKQKKRKELQSRCRRTCSRRSRARFSLEPTDQQAKLSERPCAFGRSSKRNTKPALRSFVIACAPQLRAANLCRLTMLSRLSSGCTDGA